MDPNSDLVSHALDALTNGLSGHVERELERVYGERWREKVSRGNASATSEEVNWDAHLVLLAMWDNWNDVFRSRMSFTERSLVSELREVRNRWAHQEEFDFEDTYRCLDSVRRLLKAVGDEQGVEVVESHQRELMRARYVEQEDLATRRTQVKQRRWLSVLVYISCALLLVIVAFTQLGPPGWPVAALVVVTYGYFSIRALNDSRVLLGPHECARCRRIIYMEPCPYCGPTST